MQAFSAEHYPTAPLPKERSVTQARTKAKQTPERKLIYKVLAHLFKWKESQKLKVDLVSSVIGEIKNKLGSKRMEKLTKHISECSATRLLNGVIHMWREKNVLVSDGSLKKANADFDVAGK